MKNLKEKRYLPHYTREYYAYKEEDVLLAVEQLKKKIKERKKYSGMILTDKGKFVRGIMDSILLDIDEVFGV